MYSPYNLGQFTFTFSDGWNSITTVGDSFANRMFGDCSGGAFTMNDVFNLPGGITSVGDYFASSMFYGCSGGAFMVNDVFKFPTINAVSLYNSGVFGSTFCDLGDTPVQNRAAASIIGGNAVPDFYLYTFFGSLCFSDHRYLHVFWGGDGVPLYKVAVTNGTGGGDYESGATVTVTADVIPGKAFREWEISPTVNFIDGTSETDATAKFTMPGQLVTATALYDDIPHNFISVMPSANGVVTADMDTAAAGMTVTLTVTPDSGYRLKEDTLKYNGKIITDNTFIMPDDDVTITAEFEPVPADPHDDIDYTNPDLIVPGSVSGFEINLTKEIITVPETYTVAAFSTDGGVKWKPVKDALSEMKFPKLFSKDMTLCISDTAIDKAKKVKTEAGDERPNTNKGKPLPGGTIVTFAKITKRQAAPKLVVNYAIAADKTGKTYGEWVLIEKNGATAVKKDILVGVASGKTVDAKGYGQFYEGAANGIAVTGAKKTSYFIKTVPKKNGDVYTAASKPKKLSVSDALKVPAYKVTKKPEKKNKDGTVKAPATAVIKIKKGTYVKMNDAPPVLYADKAELDVLTFEGIIHLWMEATAKKPASAKKVIS